MNDKINHVEKELKEQLKELTQKAEALEEGNQRAEEAVCDHLVQKHELTSEYEALMKEQDMQKERLVEAKMEMLKENQTQVRLIASKIIFTKLECALEDHKHYVFSQIYLYS